MSILIAIAKNIQHSLYRYFRQDKHELRSAINRVVEDINQKFVIDVLERDIFDKPSQKAFLQKAILNKRERITEAHRVEIKEYLDLLDLTVDIPTEFIPVKNERLFRTAIAHPGMRYAQAEALLHQLLLGEEFQNISAIDRAWVFDRILNEIRGRMMEDIILLETKMAYPQKNVFRLQFAIGKFDMVVADPIEINCEIYEIKHSSEQVATQYKNLIDQEKCSATEFRYGPIKRKAVIYRGENARNDDIEYLNVEDYLTSL